MKIKIKEINGEKYHYAVGALVKKNNKYLMLERRISPGGFGGPIGHVDKGETFDQALKRELREETGLSLIKASKIFDSTLSLHECHYDGTINHKVNVFEVLVSGRLSVDIKESKSHGWYSKKELSSLKLEPTWEYVFRKIGFI